MDEGERVRVLVVDDSALYRKIVREILAQIPQIEVVGVAADGKIALDKIDYLRPDLITLDIEMPTKNGLDVLRELKGFERPPGVIMLSAQTGAGAEATLTALQAGAFDFVLKPTGGDFESSVAELSKTLRQRIEIYLRRVVRTPSLVAASRMDRQREPAISRDDQSRQERSASQNTAADLAFRWPIHAVALGISTGGPPALSALLPTIPPELPVPLYIVQHMPPMFTKSLADDLNRRCQINVVEAQHGEAARPGVAYIAPGGRQMKVERDGMRIRLCVNEDLPERNCRPSVDYL
ncbi:MAG: chemotaxis protein CheB, partial [Blastopirellula sp. JB062]